MWYHCYCRCEIGSLDSVDSKKNVTVALPSLAASKFSLLSHLFYDCLPEKAFLSVVQVLPFIQ